MKLSHKLLLIVALAVFVTLFQHLVGLYLDRRSRAYETNQRTLNGASEMLLEAIVFEKDFLADPARTDLADHTEKLIGEARTLLNGLSDNSEGINHHPGSLVPLLDEYREIFGWLRLKLDEVQAERAALDARLLELNSQAMEVVAKTQYEIGLAMINVEPVDQSLHNLSDNVKNTLLWTWQANVEAERRHSSEADETDRLTTVFKKLKDARTNAEILKGYLSGDEVYSAYLEAAIEFLDWLPEQIEDIGELELEQADLSRVLGEIRRDILTAKDALLAENEARLAQLRDWIDRVRNLSAVILVVGVLAGGLRLLVSITRPLKGAMAAISTSARRTASGAAEVAEASGSVSRSAAGQAAGLEEIASALEEMAVTSRETSQLTRGAKDLMHQNIQMSSRSLKRLVDLSKRLKTIKGDGDRMAEVITAINDIAFQTNLLALNAAVEASRAGRAGAGFMVVAEAVRDLAGQAGRAATQTAELLEGNMKQTAQATEEMDRMGQDLEGIIETATVLGEKTEAITRASIEQSRGIGQIHAATREIDRSTQRVAADAEDVAAGAARMRTDAGRMREVADQLAKLVKGRKPLRNVRPTKRS